MFLAATLQDALWIVLILFFSVSIYTWSKSQITNQTISVLITIFVVYILFFRFKNLVWIVAIGVIIYWIYGKDIRKIFYSKKGE
jgi:branched-subunit amino acid transport protein AzlD